MSASLVGSEMCIRDRDPPAPPEKPAHWSRTQPEEAAVPARLIGQAALSACLLYTSDAADDM
eukprot:5384702-Alexandrium_andersonii.AAC.1